MKRFKKMQPIDSYQYFVIFYRFMKRLLKRFMQ